MCRKEPQYIVYDLLGIKKDIELVSNPSFGSDDDIPVFGLGSIVSDH